jgi:hypothetical protein
VARARRRRRRKPAAEQRVGFLGAVVAFFGVGGVAAALALVSAILALVALNKTTVSRGAVRSESGQSGIVTEPYINPTVVTKAYRSRQVPTAVRQAYEDFNEGADSDLANNTQDFRTRYSPDLTCFDAHANVIALYGPDACRSKDSLFYTSSSQVDRALLEWNNRRDQATSHSVRLKPAQLKEAMAILRAATASLVGCIVTNTAGKAVNVTITPASGYEVIAGQDKFLLEAGESRTVRLQPASELSGAAIGSGRCSVDFVAAQKVANAPTGKVWIISAAALAFAAAILGITAKSREKRD